MAVTTKIAITKIVRQNENDIWKYKGITIAGLNVLISKDDTFKLRFTQDFTLRDDPNEIDLKNTHTEWMLIRENMKQSIPDILWDKLVDSACGQNKLGQTLPSLTRVLYDDRNGKRTRYGFGPEQILADRNLVIQSLINTILNPKTSIYRNGVSTIIYIMGLDFNNIEDYFSTPAKTRETMNFIKKTARPQQSNELFFAVMNDALASNYEFSDIFKTSDISAHSIITVKPEQKINDIDIYY